MNATLLAVPGYVVALTDGGELKVIAANGKAYQEAASYEVADSETWAPAVVLPGGVLVKDLKGLAYWGWGE